jgi:DNA-binding GntR family transcriptional regulator
MLKEKRPRGRPSLGRLPGTRPRIAKTALHVEAVGMLRDLIVRGELKAGERIAETAVSEALGLSRTPLREALKLLAAEGLVELSPNRGATITPLRLNEVAALFEAVSGVERIAAELAAGRLTEPDLEHLRDLQRRMELHFEANEQTAYFDLNEEVHRSIVAGAKNEVLASAHAWLLSRAQRARFLALRMQDRWSQSVAEHRAILAALEARDAALSGRLMADHVLHTGDIVTAILKADSVNAA